MSGRGCIGGAPTARSEIFGNAADGSLSARPGAPPFLVDPTGSSSRGGGGQQGSARGGDGKRPLAVSKNDEPIAPPFGSGRPPTSGPTQGQSTPYTQRSTTRSSTHTPAALADNDVLNLSSRRTEATHLSDRSTGRSCSSSHTGIFSDNRVASSPAEDDAADDDMMELEHLIGCGTRFLHTVVAHPSLPNVIYKAVGSALVISDLTDPHNEQFLRGHDMEISAVCLNATGTLAASGQAGSTHVKGFPAPVLVWNLAAGKGKGQSLLSLEGLSRGVRRVAFSADNRFLMGCGEDGRLYIWDVQTGEVAYARCFPTPLQVWRWGNVDNTGRRPVYEAYYCIKDEMKSVVLAFDPVRRQWTLTGETMTMPSSGLVRNYNSIGVLPHYKSLIAGTDVGDMVVYRLDTGVYRASVPVCSGGVLTLAVDPASGAVFCGGGDHTIRRLVGGDMQWAVDETVVTDGKVVSLSFCNTSRELVAVTGAGSVLRIPAYNLAEKEVVSSAHTAAITAVACGSKTDSFVTCSADGTVNIWDLGNYAISARAFAPGGVGDADAGLARRGGTGRINTASGEEEGDSKGCLCACWVEERAVITGWADHGIRCSDAGTGRQLWEIPNAHRSAVTSVAVHTGASLAYLASAGDDGSVRIWALRTREMMLQFVEHQKGVAAVRVDVTAPHLLHSAGKDCAIFTYDLRTERRTVAHLTRTGQLTHLTQRLDSEQEVITCDTTGRLLTWDCDIRDPVNALQDPSRKRLRCAEVSPSGRYLATCGDDSLVKVLDIFDGYCTVAAGRAHSEPATCLQWSADERQIISVGQDRSIAVWNFYGVPPSSSPSSTGPAVAEAGVSGARGAEGGAIAPLEGSDTKQQR